MVVAPAEVPVRGAGGVSSWVEYQRASGRTPPAPSGFDPGGGGCRPGRVPVPAPSWWTLSGSLRVGWWKRAGPVVGVVRGALLGPETTGPVPSSGGGGVVSGFPASCRWSWSPREGQRPPVCGMCGLLFENCIVDASILRTGAAADRDIPCAVAFGWWSGCAGCVVVPCS